MNFAKFLRIRIPFLQNTSGQLLLSLNEAFLEHLFPLNIFLDMLTAEGFSEEEPLMYVSNHVFRSQ